MLHLASVFSFKPDAASTQAVNEQTNKECKMLGHKYLPPESLCLREHSENPHIPSGLCAFAILI
jgi:hypothetical protein